MSEPVIYRQRVDLLQRWDGARVILLERGGYELVTLGGLLAAVWAALSEPGTSEELAAAISAELEPEPDLDLDSAVVDALVELEARRLVEVVTG